jgi:hypothetical protein
MHAFLYVYVEDTDETTGGQPGAHSQRGAKTETGFD